MLELVGKTVTRIDADEESILFTFSDDSHATWYHLQDCCEYVCVEDVSGDWDDLI